jgi:hypothetical protein
MASNESMPHAPRLETVMVPPSIPSPKGGRRNSMREADLSVLVEPAVCGEPASGSLGGVRGASAP